MVHFNIEEVNLICIFHNADRRRTMGFIREALPDMDEDMRALARQTLEKLDAMSDADFDNQHFDFTDDTEE